MFGLEQLGDTGRVHTAEARTTREWFPNDARFEEKLRDVVSLLPESSRERSRPERRATLFADLDLQVVVDKTVVEFVH